MLGGGGESLKQRPIHYAFAEAFTVAADRILMLLCYSKLRIAKGAYNEIISFKDTPYPNTKTVVSDALFKNLLFVLSNMLL